MTVFFDRYSKNYLHIAIPAALEGLFMILLASADLIMVGTLGTVAVAAVSIFLQPRLIILCFSRSLAAGVTLLVSRQAGRGDRSKSADILKKSLFIGTLVLIPLHLLFFIYLEPIFYLLGASEEYIMPALDYGRLSVISVFITSLTLVLQAVQLGFGQTGVIMKTNILGNMVNVVINSLLIFGLGPFPRMGVTGAAIGTVGSTVFTLGWTMMIMKRDRFFEGGSFLPTKAYFQSMGPVFTSIFSEQGAERIGMVLFTRMAAGLGTVPFAVHSICMNICDIYYDYVMGLGKASMVLAGQSCGKGSRKEWASYFERGLAWSLLFSTIAFGLTFAFRDQIFGLYDSDPESMAMAGAIMIFVAIVSYPEAHAMVCAGVLRGSGKTGAVAAYSFFSVTVLRPLMTAIFMYYLGWGLIGTWTALLLDQCIRATCSSVLLWRVYKTPWHRVLAKIHV